MRLKVRQTRRKIPKQTIQKRLPFHEFMGLMGISHTVENLPLKILREINFGNLQVPKGANFSNLIGSILKNAKIHQNQSLDTLIFFLNDEF